MHGRWMNTLKKKKGIQPLCMCVGFFYFILKRLPLWPRGKASALRLADLGSVLAFPLEIFPGRVTPVMYKLVPQWLPCQVPGI